MSGIKRSILFGLCAIIGAMAADRAAAQAGAHSSPQGNAQVKALTGAYNASGQQLFAQFAAKPGNIVFSPYSVGAAMAMALAGARGATAVEMSKVLMHRLAAGDIDTANGEAMAILNAYDHSADPWSCPGRMTLRGQKCETQPFGDRRLCFSGMQLVGDVCIGNATPPRFAKLLAANALVLTRRGDVISDGYAALLRTKYAAEVFKGATLGEINGWVARKTEGKIDRILEKLDPDSAAVLLNAVYFKARWADAFNKDRTKDDAFNLPRSQKVQVPLMNKTDNFALVARSGYRAIRLPYEMAPLGLVVVLPDDIEGVRDVARRLDSNEVAALFAALRDRQSSKLVALALPRFKTEFMADLITPYKQAGMAKAFDSDADFSGMTGVPASRQPLHIGQIVHRAVIEVAEESTEAAAATAVEMVAPSAMPKPQPLPEPFRVDRPFLFYLVDDATGAILFQGRIADPR